MGKKSPDPDPAVGQAADATAEAARRSMDMAEALYGQTDPLRRGMLYGFGEMLGLDPELQQQFYVGGTPVPFTPGADGVPGSIYAPPATTGGRPPIEFDPSQRGILFDPVTTQNISTHPAYGAMKDTVESQYQFAKDALRESIPGTRYSGLMADQMLDLSMNRGSQLAQGTGMLGLEEAARRERLLGAALGAASGQTNAALGGMGQSGQISGNLFSSQAAMANAEANRAAGKSAGKGQLAGTALGYAILK